MTQEVVEALLSLEGLILGPLHTRLWREEASKRVGLKAPW